MPRLLSLPAAVPGPPAHPKYGGRYQQVRFLRDPIAYMDRAYREYGPLVTLSQQDRVLLAFGPEMNQQLLTRPDIFHSLGLIHRGDLGTAYRRIGMGLFADNGDVNRRRRKLLMPPFRPAAVDSYRDGIARIIRDQLAAWDDRPRDMRKEMSRLSLAVSGEVLFGLSGGLPRGPQGDEEPPFAPLSRELCRQSCSLSVRLSDPKRPSAAYRRMHETGRRMEAETLRIIEQKRAQGLGDDVLSLIIRAHDESSEFSTPELIGQAHLMIGAAYETSAHSLTWMLYLLAQHPDVAADLLDELDAGMAGDVPTVEELKRLHLLDAFTKESLRILGPVVYNPRLCVSNTQLGGVDLPKGTVVIFSHYTTHHMPDIYPEPERFRPARWQLLRPSPYEYFPFGGGTRICIGRGLATLTSKLTIAAIAKRFRLQVKPGARINRRVDITLFPRYGLPMRAFPQDRRFAATAVVGNVHEMVRID